MQSILQIKEITIRWKINRDAEHPTDHVDTADIADMKDTADIVDTAEMEDTSDTVEIRDPELIDRELGWITKITSYMNHRRTASMRS